MVAERLCEANPSLLLRPPTRDLAQLRTEVITIDFMNFSWSLPIERARANSPVFHRTLTLAIKKGLAKLGRLDHR